MTTPGATKKGDFIFDSFFTGGIGGTVVAVVLLALDLLRGEPFRTPTVLGAVLFADTPANQVAEVQLNLVVYATMVHFAAFVILGIGASALMVYVKAVRTRAPLLILLLLVMLEAGVRVMSAILAPGLVEAVGPGRVLIANAAAAAAMGGFLIFAHREDTPQAG